jgi:simple sugar transport system ATP-binding protein
MTTAMIELRDASKSFGSIRAVTDVSLKAYPGEVLCLLGGNGAGKSTLIKMLSGVHRPSSGTLFIDGEQVELDGPADARRRGIATVHQDIGTVPLMSVADNFFIGGEITKGRGPFRRVDAARQREVALERVHALGIRRVQRADQLVGTLSGGERQALACARATYFGARILIMDEPTAALGVRESSRVIELISRVRDNGVAVIFITHNAHHALRCGDRFVVLIHGAVAASFKRGERSREELLNLMAGGEKLEELEIGIEEDLQVPTT